MFLVNGQPEETISLLDRGFQYGDGLFETIAMDNKKPLNWDRHLGRLQEGCERLRISCPSGEVLLGDIDKLDVPGARSVLKIIVTRGQGGRGYGPPGRGCRSTVVHGVYPWPDYPPENSRGGVVARFCNFRLGINPELAGIKHMNRLEQIIARSEWDEPGIAEGIMLDTCDRVIEGTMSNLFIVRDGKLLTPNLENCGVSGITRASILDAAQKMKIPARITTLHINDLYSADELFLCNSILGIWSIRELDNHKYTDFSCAQTIRNDLLEHSLILA